MFFSHQQFMFIIEYAIYSGDVIGSRLSVFDYANLVMQIAATRANNVAIKQYRFARTTQFAGQN
jgi:hypothetical protein